MPDPSTTAKMMHSLPSISPDGARHALAGALAEAARLGVSMSVAVVDNAGHLLSFHRLEGAIMVSIDAAVQKARTAAQAGVNTRLLQELVDREMPSLLAVTQLMTAPGGVPVMLDGVVIGGVGASGAALHEDEAVAQAGADAIMAVLNTAQAN